MPFLDYATGEIKQGAQYFKPLSKTIIDYIGHIENKFEVILEFQREKHIHVDGLVYIGKEANNIEEQPLDVEKPQVFINEEEIKNFILALTPEEARKIGISRNEPYYLKKNVMEES